MKTYSVGEAAALLGLSASALRYYDKEGLLPFVERTSGGMRQFRESDIEWLRLISCLKATGMPIRDIRRFLDLYGQGDSTIEERRALFHDRREAVLRQQAALRETLETIEFKCWLYDCAASAGTLAFPGREDTDSMPAHIREIVEKRRLLAE